MSTIPTLPFDVTAEEYHIFKALPVYDWQRFIPDDTNTTYTHPNVTPKYLISIATQLYHLLQNYNHDPFTYITLHQLLAKIKETYQTLIHNTP